MVNPRSVILHAMAFVGCFLLAGCVLAEVHATISPIPPWFNIDLKGLDDSKPPVVPTSQPSP